MISNNKQGHNNNINNNSGLKNCQLNVVDITKPNMNTARKKNKNHNDNLTNKNYYN